MSYVEEVLTPQEMLERVMRWIRDDHVAIINDCPADPVVCSKAVMIGQIERCLQRHTSLEEYCRLNAGEGFTDGTLRHHSP